MELWSAFKSEIARQFKRIGSRLERGVRSGLKSFLPAALLLLIATQGPTGVDAQQRTCSVVQPGQHLQLHFRGVQTCFRLSRDVRTADTVTLFFDFYHDYSVRAKWGTLCSGSAVQVQGEGRLDFRAPSPCARTNVTAAFSAEFLRLPPVNPWARHPVVTDYVWFLADPQAFPGGPQLRTLNSAATSKMETLFAQTCRPFSDCLWRPTFASDLSAGRLAPECSVQNGWTCSAAGDVTGLHLDNKGLRSSSLFAALQPFRTTLEVVVLTRNPGIQGRLPTHFFQEFPRLVVFHVDHTGLGDGNSSFPCPPHATAFSSAVQSLRLSWTRFSGAFPVCWLRAPRLTLFAADFALFDRPVPLNAVVAAIRPHLLDVSAARAALVAGHSSDWTDPPAEVRQDFRLQRLSLPFNSMGPLSAHRVVARLQGHFPHLAVLSLRASGLEGRFPALCLVCSSATNSSRQNGTRPCRPAAGHFSPENRNGPILDLALNRIARGLQLAAESCHRSESDGTERELAFGVVDFSFNGAAAGAEGSVAERFRPVALELFRPFFGRGGLAVLAGLRVSGCPFQAGDPGPRGDGSQRSLRWFTEVAHQAVLCGPEAYVAEGKGRGEKGSAVPHVHQVECPSCSAVVVFLALMGIVGTGLAIYRCVKKQAVGHRRQAPRSCVPRSPGPSSATPRQREGLPLDDVALRSETSVSETDVRSSETHRLVPTAVELSDQ